MVTGFLAINQLVMRLLRIEQRLHNDAGVLQQIDRSIGGRLRNSLAALAQLEKKFFGRQCEYIFVKVALDLLERFVVPMETSVVFENYRKAKSDAATAGLAQTDQQDEAAEHEEDVVPVAKRDCVAHMERV